MSQTAKPLSGISVVDVSELLPGPFFTHCLVELGASVTKVERPPAGDPLRVLRPGSYTALNHGKTVVQLDLKSADGVAELRELISAADVFVEGSRPGVMDRLGVGYGDASALQPELVYVSISGYGQTGPLRTVPGHDLNYQAAAGILALSGADDLAPGLGVDLPISDFVSAMYALSSTLAALLQRVSTRRGQHLDVSITDSMTHWLNPISGHLQHSGITASADQRRGRFGKPGYAVFKSGDERWLAIGAMEQHFQKRLLEALEIDIAELPPAASTDRVEFGAAMNARVAAKIKNLDADTAMKLLTEHDVPVSEVVAPTDVWDTANARARGMFTDVDGLKVARYPVHLDGMDVSTY